MTSASPSLSTTNQTKDNVPPNSKSSSSSSQTNKLSSGGIAGVVIAVIVVVACLALLAARQFGIVGAQVKHDEGPTPGLMYTNEVDLMVELNDAH